MSIPAAVNFANTCSQSPPSVAMIEPSSVSSASAFKVPSGIVSIVSGAARALTYRTGEAERSLTPVLAQRRRCGHAPAL